MSKAEKFWRRQAENMVTNMLKSGVKSFAVVIANGVAKYAIRPLPPQTKKQFQNN